MSDDKKNNKTPVKIIGSKTKDNHFVILTGGEYQILVPEYVPMVDAHMHIQSNNCAPMTLQWGQLLCNVAGGITSLTKDKTKKTIVNCIIALFKFKFPLLAIIDLISPLTVDNIYFNYNAISKLMAFKANRDALSGIMSKFLTIVVKDFGKIGMMPTDAIAHLFMRNSKRMADALAGYKNINVEEMKKISEIRKAEVEKDFAVQTSYYFKNMKPHHMSIALPMDMSYAHYWGNYGIPVYLPVGKDSYFYINDYFFSILFIDILKQNFWDLADKVKEFEHKMIKKIPEIRNRVEKDIADAKKKVSDYFNRMIDDLKIKKAELIKALNELSAKFQKGCEIIKNNTMEMIKKTDDVILKYNEMLLEYNRHLDDEAKKFAIKEIDEYQKLKNSVYKYKMISIDDYYTDIIIEITKEMLEKSVLSKEAHEELEKKMQKSKDEFKSALVDYGKTVMSKVDKTGKIIMKEAANIEAKKQELIKKLEAKTAKLKDEAIKKAEEFLQKVQEIKEEVKKVVKDVQFAVKVYGEGNKVIPYDIDLAKSKEFFILDKPVVVDVNTDPVKTSTVYSDEEYTNKFLSKKYNHFVEIAPGEKRHTYTFEDYTMQRDNTIGIALKYPFEMLPFYHVDPRRYYDETNQNYFKSLKQNIKSNHGFFTVERTKTYKVKLNPVIFTDKYLSNELFGKTNKTSCADLYKMLPPDGVFVGVKMYTELGYPPSLFNPNSDNVKKHFKNQMPGLFKHMKEIFKHCIKNKIPVTCHGSPGGMTIADTYIYHKESKKVAGEKNRPYFEALYGIPPKVFMDSIDYMDDKFVSPKAWEEILTGELSELRIDLAHFGSYDRWLGKQTNLDWRSDLAKLIQSKSHVYTDISCYMSGIAEIPDELVDSEIEKIKSKAKSLRDVQALEDAYIKESAWLGYIGIKNWKPTYSENLYKLKPDLTKEQLSMVRTIMRSTGFIKDDVATVGDELYKYLTGQYGDALKKKIMMGSDWHMTERKIVGAGEYYCRMFDLLKYITKKMNKYDLWHQFSVINPLRFLGFLKDDDQTIDIDRVNKHNENIANFTKRTDVTPRKWIQDYKVSEDEKKVILSGQYIEGSLKLQGFYFNEYKKAKIKPSDKIKDKDDKFVILKDWNDK